MDNAEQSKAAVNISEIVYFMFAAMLFFAKGMGWYDGQRVFKICLFIALVFWCTKMILTPYSVRELIFMFILLASTAVSYRMSGDKGILLAAMVITGVKNVDIRRCAKGWTWVWGISCLFTIVLCFAGIAPNLYSPRDKYGILLHSCNLGFPNHSVLQMSYLAFVILLVYAYYDRLDRKSYIKLLLGNILVFLYTFSITGFAGTLLFLLLVYIYRIAENKGKGHAVLRGAAPWVLPLCAAFSILTPLLPQDSVVYSVINKILNGRLALSSIYMTSGPYTLFGCRIYDILGKAGLSFLDSSYVSSLAQYGIVTFLLMMFIYEAAIVYMKKYHKDLEIIVTSTLLITALEEPMLLNTSFKNNSLFLIGAMIFAWFSGRNERIKMLSVHDGKCEIRLPGEVVMTGDEQNKLSESRYRGARIAAGCMCVVPYILSMQMQRKNITTKFCEVLTLKGILRPEGIRAFFTWFLLGYCIVLLAQHCIVTRKIRRIQ